MLRWPIRALLLLIAGLLVDLLVLVLPRSLAGLVYQPITGIGSQLLLLHPPCQPLPVHTATLMYTALLLQ